MHRLYILRSIRFKKNYTGVTKNIEKRLKKHNAGLVKSTKHWRPWIVIYSEIHNTLSDAKKREWFLKCTPQGEKLKKKILKTAGIPAHSA
jgi:putative endonuclease